MAPVRFESPPDVPALNLHHTRTGRKTIIQGPYGPELATPGRTNPSESPPSSPKLRRSPRRKNMRRIPTVSRDPKIVKSQRGACAVAGISAATSDDEAGDVVSHDHTVHIGIHSAVPTVPKIVKSQRGACAVAGISAATNDEADDVDLGDHNQCFFCCQGGYIVTCTSCRGFAACFSMEGMPGCIPAKFLTSWVCPPCHRLSRSTIPYPCPSRSIGGSQSGMDNRPLILYNVYFDDGVSFSGLEASTMILEYLAYSRFIGAEDNLLLLRLKFSDLASRQTRTLMSKNRAAMSAFAQKRKNARLIITISTHADPQDGGLLYGDRKFGCLSMILDHILGPCEKRNIPLAHSLLFIISCGGFVHHAMQDIREASSCFDSTFAFGADNVDPLTVASHFIHTVVDYHIFGCESLEPVLVRAFKPEVASHTPVYVFVGPSTIRLVNATWRRRPNGEDIRCCSQIPKYIVTQRRQHNVVILMRCFESGHQGSRNLRIFPLPQESGVRKFIQSGKNRIMLEFL